jgi:hypothetical protein
MCLEVKQNILGGQSLWISPGADLADVPSPYRELIQDEHREAFSNTTAYFKHLAGSCDLDGMKQWLAEIAAVGRCGLQIHRVEMFGSRQEDVLVRVISPKFRCHSSFRLQTFMGRNPHILGLPNTESEFVRAFGRQQVSLLPDPLRMMFELIDGTVEMEAWQAGGINSIADLYFGYIESQLPIEEGTSPELLESPIFYTNPCGDTLVACGDKAYWYLHEICGFREAGELSEVVSGYFHEIMRHREWLDVRQAYAKDGRQEDE